MVLWKKAKRRFFSIYDQYAISRQQDLARRKKQQRWLRVIKVTILVVVLVLFSRLLINLPGYFDKIRKPFQNIQGELVNRNSINFKYRTNIIVGSREENYWKQIGIISVSEGNSEAVILLLDNETRLITQKGWVSLNDLVKLPSQELSLDRLAAGITRSLGYHIDGYLITMNSQEWIEKEQLKDVREFVFTPTFFVRILEIKNYLDDNLRTNLSLGNILELTRFLKSVRFDNVKYVDLRRLQDKEGVLDTTLAESRLGISLIDQSISGEDLTVEIINASNTDGLGPLFGKVIHNMGGKVLSVEKNAVISKSEILTGAPNSHLVKRLKDILKAEVKYLDSSNNVDVKILLGEDYARFFNF